MFRWSGARGGIPYCLTRQSTQFRRRGVNTIIPMTTIRRISNSKAKPFFIFVALKEG